MKYDFEVIENTKNARNKYSCCCGSNDVELTIKEIKALCDGKVVAFNDGEYSTYLYLKEE